MNSTKGNMHMCVLDFPAECLHFIISVYVKIECIIIIIIMGLRILFWPSLYTIVVDGGWSHWFPGKCSTPACGGEGVQTDVRLCNNPIPTHGGEFCKGVEWKNTTCFVCPCELRYIVGAFFFNLALVTLPVQMWILLYNYYIYVCMYP